MKKRFLSATLAAILAASSLSVAAFADDPAGAFTPASDDDQAATGTQVVAVTGATTIPAIKVNIPTAITYVANPYKLTVKTGTNASDTDNLLVISPIITVENKGTSKVSVAVTATPTKGENSTAVISNTGAVPAKSTAKDIALWVEPAVHTYKAGSVKVTGRGTDATYAAVPETNDYKFTDKYNAKTCALATEYTPAVIYEAKKAEALKELIAADEDFDVNNKTINANLKKADAAAAFTGDTGAEKARGLVSYLIGKGVKITYTPSGGTATQITSSNISAIDGDTVLTTNLIKTPAIGVKTPTITLFTLAAAGDAVVDPTAIANYDNLDATEKEKFGTTNGNNVGKFKIGGVLNQASDENWASTDTVALSLKFDIKLLSN